MDDRSGSLWVHCKNVEADQYFVENEFDCKEINWFWHENDTLTLTSKQYMWVYPGKQPIIGSIAVMPEIHNENISKCVGVCSDYINNYK